MKPNKKLLIESAAFDLISKHGGILQSDAVSLIAANVKASESYVSFVMAGIKGIDRRGPNKKTRLFLKNEKQSWFARFLSFLGV